MWGHIKEPCVDVVTHIDSKREKIYEWIFHEREGKFSLPLNELFHSLKEPFWMCAKI